MIHDWNKLISGLIAQWVYFGKLCANLRTCYIELPFSKVMVFQINTVQLYLYQILTVIKYIILY